MNAGRAARAITDVAVDAAVILAAWGALLLAENVVVGLLWKEHFSGAWEISLARHTAVPLAFAILAPVAAVASGAWRVAGAAARGVWPARVALGLCAAVAAAAVGLGVSQGRHFAVLPVRAAFVAGCAALGARVAVSAGPRIVRLSARPAALAGLGVAVAALAWTADGGVLPRLYPAFHAAMGAATLLGAALVGLSFRKEGSAGLLARTFAAAIALTACLCIAHVPAALRGLDRAANVRIVLVEHAPLVGAAVALETGYRALVGGGGAAFSEDGAAPGGGAAAGPGLAPPGEVARSLDWSGHDIVLFSVDALRADHVSAYGYARATTPHVDALAREGTLFESAYCPTPHTSYSVTSMLTGKYLRPLLALGIGGDSETWPEALRRYGWRTAAFYPPAVFFIDEERFTGFEQRHLGFEYAKVEFADPALRERQIAEYLDRADDRPVFLWVHFFEPHEPYVAHPEHPFAGGDADVDAYDSEIATVDEGIGRIVARVRERRPGAVFVVTADHGEEFGDHGGRYHGTTVYEEQVRVPLVVVGPGVRPGARVGTVVQTVDLLPTVLSAVGIPRPARVRGRDLGALLSAPPPPGGDPGFAFSEAQDYALVASGDDRLICERRAAACALYRPRSDPLERHDVSAGDPQRFAALRAMLRTLELDHGRFEASAGPAWPEALRRGMQGETDAAPDVAPLLDDAAVSIRRKAAEVLYRLRSPDTAPALRRAFARDEDDEVKRWCALALARLGQPAGDVASAVDALLEDGDRDWRRRAALVLGERGDARVCEEIGAWWTEVAPAAGKESADGEPPRLGLDLPQAEELLGATGKARCRGAVPALVRALADVRARPFVADTLGRIGDERAGPALVSALASEPYVTARPHEARALLALGARDWQAPTPAPSVDATLRAPRNARSAELLVLVSDADASLEARAAGSDLPAVASGTEVRALNLAPLRGPEVHIELHVSSGGVVAAWLVPRGRLD